jgi:CubicO group peptidase (beta-lactamase class C family)
MLKRLLALCCLVAITTTPLHAQVDAAQEARTLDEVIAKYRTDRVMDSEGQSESGPLFMSLGERRLAFAHFDRLYPTRLVSAGATPMALPEALMDLGAITFSANGKEHTVAEFLQSEHLMGLVVIQEGKVRLEHYAPDHHREARWVSFSVTKSVTSMLIGAAIQDGYIASEEDLIVKYLPRLEGSEYGQSRIKDILHMASGMQWNEDYEDPASDVAIAGALNGVNLTNYLYDKPRVAAPGVRFNYNTAESNLLGEILRSAIGMNAAPYLEQKIWQPMGMESSATWLLSAPNGRETGGCCLSATVRDYARLGLFALADGVLPDGTRVLPEGWMAASTSPSQGFDGYGYKWWLYGEGRFRARGIFAQSFFIDPEANLVIATHGNAQSASDSDHHYELDAAIMAISEYFRGNRREQ